MDKHKQSLTTFVDPNCMIYIGKYVENYKADSSGAKGGMHPPGKGRNGIKTEKSVWVDDVLMRCVRSNPSSVS